MRRPVTVLEYLQDSPGDRIRCWCNLRQDERTFRVSNIVACFDQEEHPFPIWKFLEDRFPNESRHFKILRNDRLRDVLEKLRDERDSSATERQVLAVASLGYGIAAQELTRGQASALLSTWNYAKAVLLPLLGRVDGYPQQREIEAELTLFIMLDEDLRNRALKWSQRRFVRGTTYATPQPRRDSCFERATIEARRLLKLHRLPPLR